MSKYWAPDFQRKLDANQMALCLVQQALKGVCGTAVFRLKKIQYCTLSSGRDLMVVVSGSMTVDSHFNTPFSCTCTLRLNARDQWEHNQGLVVPIDLERTLRRVLSQPASRTTQVRSLRHAIQI